jgi:hypothetical protein
MTDDRRTADGVDLETLEEFAEHAAGNPEAVQLGLGASATYEGTAVHSLAEVDSYELGDETIARETREDTTSYGGWKEMPEAGGLVGAIGRFAAEGRISEEANRVLEPGGRLALFGVIGGGRTPESVESDADPWAACLGGADRIDGYTAFVEAAGFSVTDSRDTQCEFVSDRRPTRARRTVSRASHSGRSTEYYGDR